MYFLADKILLVRNISRKNFSVLSSTVYPQLHKKRLDDAFSKKFSSAEEPRKPRYFWKAVFGGAFLLTGAVGYVWYDADSRKFIEENVPYTKKLFDLILFDSKEFRSLEAVMLKPKISAELKSKEFNITKDIVKLQPDNLSDEKKTDVDVPINEIKVNVKSEEDSIISTVKDAFLYQQAALATESEFVMKSVSSATQIAADVCHMALRSQVELETCIRRHTSRLKKALDNQDIKLTDALWAHVTRDFDKKTVAAKKASEDLKSAELALNQLEMAIDKARKVQGAQESAALISAQQQLHDVRFDLAGAVSSVQKAQSEANLVHQYRDLVEQAKKKFTKEMDSMIFDVNSEQHDNGSSKTKLSEDQLNQLLAYAHRRVEQLQRRIVEFEALEKQRVEVALEQQSRDLEVIHEKNIQRELARAHEQLRLNKESWELDQRIKWEAELRRELARQAAAHSDHLAQVLAVQRTEIAHRAEQDLRERLLREREIFQVTLTAWTARVQGIESAVEGRAALEKQARHAQELWLAAHALEAVVRYGKDDWKSTPRPLASVVLAVQKAASDEPDVLQLISAVPSKAKTRGVWSEEALKERFRTVRRAAAQVALLPETGFTLPQYLWSRVYGLLSFAGGPLVQLDEQSDEEQTLALLRTAEHHLQLGELETALRFMCQLRGYSRILAHDWIQETRLHLETRQTAQIICNMAAALGIGAL